MGADSGGLVGVKCGKGVGWSGLTGVDFEWYLLSWGMHSDQCFGFKIYFLLFTSKLINIKLV